MNEATTQISDSSSTLDRDQLVATYIDLPRKVAVLVAKKTRSFLDIDDLVAFGHLGLIQASQRYSRDHGTSFVTYAYPRIYGAIVDGLASMLPVPRSYFRNNRELRVSSIDASEGTGLQASALCSEPEQWRTLYRNELSDELSKVLRHLPAVQIKLLHLHYERGLNLAEAGRCLGRSRSWACRAHASALAQLHGHLSTLEEKLHFH